MSGIGRGHGRGCGQVCYREDGPGLPQPHQLGEYGRGRGSGRRSISPYPDPSAHPGLNRQTGLVGRPVPACPDEAVPDTSSGPSSPKRFRVLGPDRKHRQPAPALGFSPPQQVAPQPELETVGRGRARGRERGIGGIGGGHGNGVGKIRGGRGNGDGIEWTLREFWD